MEINAQPKGLTRLQKNGKDLNEDRKGGARDPNGNIEMTNKKNPCNLPRLPPPPKASKEKKISATYSALHSNITILIHTPDQFWILLRVLKS